MTQNMSSKMLQSYMIKNRVRVNYNTSATTSINNIIIGAEFDSNKNLLFSLGYDVYTSYFNSILRSSGLTSTQKYNIQETFYSITDLSDNEKKQLGIYEEDATDISNAQAEYETSILQNPDFIFYCSLYDNYKFKALVIKNMQCHYKLIPGKKYIFNLEDESNTGTTLSFSKQQQLFEDVEGIYRIGSPGSSGACLIYIPQSPLQYHAIHVYNKDEYSSKSFTEFGYIYKKILLEYFYNIPYPNNALFYNAQENFVTTPLFGDSVLHTVENNGPKYILSSDASYTETITDISYTSFTWYKQISDDKKLFGIYYGYYNLQYRFPSNRVALINKGVNSHGISMENLIQVYGNDSDVEVHYLEGLDENGDLDGSYNFYDTPLTIKVLGDFEKCSLYTKILGYNKLEDILFFVDEYANYSITNPDGYTDVSDGNIIGLYPESEIHFHDISSDILNLSNIYNDVSVNVDDRPRISLNYDGSNSSYDSSVSYGLYKGQYIIKNIPEDRPIAIINEDASFSKAECIKYFGPEQYKYRRLGPDGKTMFDYYYQTMIIQVFGDFGKVSIYEYNDGFCGGENLLMYSDISGKFQSEYESEFQSWYELYDASFNVDCSSISVSGDVIDNMFTNIYQVESYISCDISLDSNQDNALLFDDISDSSTKYCFDTGNFVLMNVHEDNPIAFLNKGREDLFSYDGYYAYSTTGTASDGNTYTYYSGNINITVAGDFGQLSFETLENSYMGGFRKLMFNSGTKGEAVHHWGVNTYYNMLTTDSSATPQNYYINVRTNTRVIHYSEDYVTYRFAGYDRNGVIDSEEDNPELTFAIGDIVYFTFEDNYEQPFGIYTYHNLLTDEQLITNNSNNTSSQIEWIPNLVVSNYYYYRSEKYVTNFMNNAISIINNENAEIIIDISNVYTDPQFDISYDASFTPMFEGSTPFSILPKSFTIEFDEIVNINSSRNLYLYNFDTSSIEITIPATQLTQNTEKKSATYVTEFSKYNVSSLEFDTSYALLMDEELFENIYYNTISGEIETFGDISAYNILQFETETKHEPTFGSITPDSSSTLVDVSGYIEIEFSEPVLVPADTDVPGGNNIAFVDSDGNSINYTNDDSSGNIIFIYYSGLNYNTVYSVSFDDYSIVDSSNIQFTISDSSLIDYSIQTIEDPRPQLQYYIPNNDISNVYIDQPITLIFNETVYLDTSSNGRIQIDDENGTFTYFDVSNNDDVSGIIYGSGTNTLRIYPFDADLSFADNSTYILSIDSNVIKDVCDNYYPGISTSDSNPITFTTGDSAGDAQEGLASETSGNIVSDDSGNNYIVFNSDTSYEEKQFTLSVGTYTIDISESYPFTILNCDISDIVVISISNDTIEIDVSGGSDEADATTGDYFVFTNSDGETISLANGDLKFMRGQSYTFRGLNISNDYTFVIYYDDISASLTNTDVPYNFTIPTDMSTDSNSFYYCVKKTNNNYSTTNYDATLTLLYGDISENNENGNGSYDFYYGNVTLDICSNDFGSFSFYTYNNGYMGGKYAFTFEDDYSG